MQIVLKMTEIIVSAGTYVYLSRFEFFDNSFSSLYQ